MLERGLAYRKRSTVNWCPSCQTVLANEQVEDGRCWRCNSEVTPREIDGWFFKITAYADELLAWCDRLPGWPERVLTMQRNWIGRSEGVEFDLPTVGRPGVRVRVFTTRPDTAFGMTYAVLAPEHPVVDHVVTDAHERAAVAQFRAEVAKESEIERLAADRPKRGLRLQARVVNPFTGAAIPLFLANYVLMSYGTGAIMAVPGEDQRDWDFARQHGLPIIETVRRPPGWTGEAYTGDGLKINSGFLDGLTVADAKRKATDWLVAQGLGEGTVKYRLRDWGISRQRYWGAPIPVLYCEACGMVPEAEENLPVVLPRDVQISGKGGSPLAEVASFVNAKCPRCRGRARRETDTMDTFVESSWYFLRYCSPRYEGGIVERASRFLNRVWRFVIGHLDELKAPGATARVVPASEDGRAFRRVIHDTIRRVTDDIEHDFHFNTAISAVMELVNALSVFDGHPGGRVPPAERPPLLREAVETILRLLGPFCPHITEELWSQLGHRESVF